MLWASRLSAIMAWWLVGTGAVQSGSLYGELWQLGCLPARTAHVLMSQSAHGSLVAFLGSVLGRFLPAGDVHALRRRFHPCSQYPPVPATFSAGQYEDSERFWLHLVFGTTIVRVVPSAPELGREYLLGRLSPERLEADRMYLIESKDGTGS